MDLPVELKSPRKGLINIKNKDQKCFYGVMLDILILQKNIQKELEIFASYKPTVYRLQLCYKETSSQISFRINFENRLS